MWRTLLRLLRQRRAVAAVEFAMLAPLIVLLAGGAVEIGSLLRVYAGINRLTMNYAQSFVGCGSDSNCQTDLQNFASSTTLSNIAPQLNPANLTIKAVYVEMQGNALTAVHASWPTTTTPTLQQLATVQALAPTSAINPTPTYYAIVVTLTYNYSLSVFSLILSPLIGSNFAITYSAAQLLPSTVPQ